MGYAAHAGSETGAAWVIQQLREAFPYDTAPRYLIFDRDAIFSPAVVTVVRAMGIKPRGIAYRSPWQNGVAERWIGSCRRQLLEHVVGATSFGSYAPTSATITRTVVIWDWARTPHTNDLLRGDPQIRQDLWRCHVWVAYIIATSGAKRLETDLWPSSPGR